MSITKEFDTITAISTPLGEGAIGIVRLSGTDAVAIANKVFKGKNLESVTFPKDLYTRGCRGNQHTWWCRCY